MEKLSTLEPDSGFISSARVAAMQEGQDMVNQATLRAKIKEDSLEQTASYFGLIVEVIDRMPSLTLVRYRNREFVVSTEDLVPGEESQPC